MAAPTKLQKPTDGTSVTKKPSTFGVKGVKKEESGANTQRTYGVGVKKDDGASASKLKTPRTYGVGAKKDENNPKPYQTP